MARSGVTFKGTQIYELLGMEASGLAPEGTIPTVKCSFCEANVSRCELTSGTNRASSVVDLVPTYDAHGTINGYLEEFTFNSRPVQACPKCASLVQTVKFPSFD